MKPLHFMIPLPEPDIWEIQDELLDGLMEDIDPIFFYTYEYFLKKLDYFILADICTIPNAGLRPGHYEFTWTQNSLIDKLMAS